MSVATAEPSAPPAAHALTAQQEAFVRAELIRRLFEGSAQSRYFSFVLWPVIAAIYWRQIDLLELAPPFAVHVVVTLGFDVLRRAFNRANPADEEVIRWGWWFAGLSFLAGACWGTAGYILASKEYELQRMLLGLVLLATITTAVPIRSAHPPTFYTFAVATTAPLLFVLLTASDPFYQLVGIAGGAYVGHLMAYVRDVHRWQYDNIALAYQKEDLARRLQVAYDEARLARDSAIDAQREAESANQAKSTFLATVSHEIRTPMNGVLGMIDVLERSPLSVEQREALGTVRYSASALLRIIDDILDFSKIEAGRLDLESIELSTVELIEGVAETLAPQAAAKGLKLAAYVGADVPDRVTGDPLRLQQILFNLLGNAIKFTETGSVRLSLEKCRRLDALHQGGRQRHRPQRRATEPPVPALRAGRQLDHAPLRRHRPRPFDRAPSRRGHAGRCRGAERARQGLDLHRHGLPRRGRARRRPARNCRCRAWRFVWPCPRPTRRRRSRATSRTPAHG